MQYYNYQFLIKRTKPLNMILNSLMEMLLEKLKSELNQ